MAHSPRNMTAWASPNSSAALTPSPAPRITIAVLMNSSGRAATDSPAQSAGNRLPTTSRPTRATRYPASPVRPSDQEIPMALPLVGRGRDVGVVPENPAPGAERGRSR